MQVIFQILSLSRFFVRSPLVEGDIPIRKDCYKSLSNPPIYINLSHYFPSSPLYFTAIFYYERYSVLSGYKPQIEQFEYDFRIFNDHCNISALFTTMGNDFKKIHVQIRIYLTKYYYRMLYIFYNFYKGFSPGYYELLSDNNNFAVTTEILNVTEKRLGNQVKLDVECEEYLKSLLVTKNNLCIITDNNKAIVLKIDYEPRGPSGFISGVAVHIKNDQRIIGSRKYPAFECHNNNKYPKREVVFITDGEKYKVNFNIFYWKYIAGMQIPSVHRLDISDADFNYVNNLNKIPSTYLKVFLIKLHKFSKLCPDNSKATIYFSENLTTYMAIVNKRVNISNGVEIYRDFHRSHVDPCAD